MGSTTIQARFGEDTYPIGRFILDRARALGMSRTELVRRLGYRRDRQRPQGARRTADDRHGSAADRKASRRRSPSGRGNCRRRHGGDRPTAARRGVSTHSRPRDCIQDSVQTAPALRNRA